jgi:V/A-type H+-transporting ATPase subunit I
MAISKIKKIEIIGLKKDADAVIRLLQQLGAVELTAVERAGTADTQNIKAAEQLHLAEVDEAISYLAGFEKKKGFFESIIKFKPLVFKQQLKDIMARFDYQDFIKRLSHLRNHLKNLCQHKERLYQERQSLVNWQRLRMPLEDLRSTQTCGILLGTIRNADYSNLLGDFKKEGINLFCDVIKQDKTNSSLVIFYLLKYFEQLDNILKQHHFNIVTLPRHKCSVVERLFGIEREAAVLEGQIREAKASIAQLSEDRFRLMIVYDYMFNTKRVQDAEGYLFEQNFTFLLNGWVRASDIKRIEAAITKNFKSAAIFISQPQGDEIPVDLENNSLIRPFEFITKIYGMPKYNELDPTPFLAPFFFLYFGFCVSDTGYGLCIILLSIFILKRYRLGPQGLRFFKLFLLCGISTVIIGILTGSWFGNLLDIVGEHNSKLAVLRNIKDRLVLLDPLKEPTKLLGIALSLGILQVWFGNIVAAIGNIKNRRYLDVLLDQVTMLTFIFGLTGLGLIFLKLLDVRYMKLFKYCALSGALALLFTQGRFEKGISSKFFSGAFVLYNSVSGYLSDILSYSRLWALGLVTSVMANTINLISIQSAALAVSIAPFIKRIQPFKILIGGAIVIIIFITGHTISFFMNLLGAFVHPVRLQFVEFFSKFFKGGGNPFKPFKIESKYIEME